MKLKPGLSCLFVWVYFLFLPSVLTAAAGKLNVLLIVSDDLRDTAHFIRDIRKDLGAPALPFVIAETGMSGPGHS